MTNSSINSTSHGCCAIDNIILPTESVEDFRAVEAAWNATFTPQDETTTRLINQLVSADWLYQRSIRTLTNIEQQIFTAEPNPLNWTDTHHKAIARFQRYRTANQNAFHKARKAVEDHLKFHANERRQDLKMEIAQIRVQIYERKNQPPPTFEESLVIMRKQAEALGFPIPDKKPTV
jgi:DNA repair ATPase RecN